MPANTPNEKSSGEPDERDVFCKVQDAFRLFARNTSAVLGTAWSFVIALLTIIIWAGTGHIFGYSDTWQLIINTGTTIVTFLMVFLIQNTQNRDSKAVHIKLDELIAPLVEQAINWWIWRGFPIMNCNNSKRNLSASAKRLTPPTPRRRKLRRR